MLKLVNEKFDGLPTRYLLKGEKRVNLKIGGAWQTSPSLTDQSPVTSNCRYQIMGHLRRCKTVISHLWVFLLERCKLNLIIREKLEGWNWKYWYKLSFQYEIQFVSGKPK